MMFSVNASAASSVSATLTSSVKSVQSSYELVSASKMSCKVTSASKYPIKFQGYGKNSLYGTTYPTLSSAVYNVGGSGTQTLTRSYNYNSVKLTGWNVNVAVKNCSGTGKIY